MKYFFIFLIGGILLIGVRNIDILNGLFLLRGSEKDFRDIVFFIMLLCWAAAASLFLSTQKRGMLFLCVSVFFAATHLVWFSMGQTISLDAIPIRESALYFEEGYQSFLKWSDVDKEFVYIAHFSIIIVLFVCFLSIMGATVGARRVYRHRKEHRPKNRK